MYKKMRCVYLHTCLAILQTHNLGGNGCKAYQNLVLNGTGPLKLLHLCTVTLTVAEPRQACLSAFCNYNVYSPPLGWLAL